MLEIKRSAISIEAQDLLELEKIITDADEKSALRFLKKVVYDRIYQGQKGSLKSHLDSGGNPVDGFMKDNK